MGNYISCALLGQVSRKKSARVIKVIFPSGEIRPVNEAAKAAELMLEAPNYFIVDTKSMRIGRRFAALSAEEDLELGSVYVFFQMRRLNSVVTAADLAVVFLAASSVSKRRGGGRISPDERFSAPRLRLSMDGAEEYSTPEFRRLLSSRSKKPLLETIVEEPVSVR